MRSNDSASTTDTFQSSFPIWKKAVHKLLPFTKPKGRQWTVLYYGAGNNNLSRDLGMEMGGLRNAGSSDEIQVVAQLAKDGPKSRAVRGAMAKIPLRFGAVRPEFVESETLDADMGQKSTLADFLEWGMKTYPAQHYLVIQAGHGNGHRGSMTDDKTNSIISLKGQREAFESAPAKTDLLLKESCMGASLEEAYEMKDSVGYFAASQDVTSGNVKLGQLINDARQAARKDSLEPEQMLDLMVSNRSERATTLTIVDQSELAEVGSALAEFTSAMNEDARVPLREAATQTARVKPDIDRLLSENEIVRVSEEKRIQYRDSLGFLDVSQTFAPELNALSQGLADRISDSIVYHYSAPEYSDQTGLSWNISPDPGITAGKDYQNLALAEDTGWTGTI